MLWAWEVPGNTRSLCWVVKNDVKKVHKTFDCFMDLGSGQFKKKTTKGSNFPKFSQERKGGERMDPCCLVRLRFLFLALVRKEIGEKASLVTMTSVSRVTSSMLGFCLFLIPPDSV